MSEQEPLRPGDEQTPDSRSPAEPAEAREARIPGSAKGLFVVPEDFDAPLDDFREYT